MKRFLNKLFSENNDNYNKAKNGLLEVKKGFDGFVISFPDVTPNEIMLIKEKWETLPSTISKDVEVMAVKSVKEYKSIITKFNSNSYIMPHKHSDLYEIGKILKGQIQDRLTGNIYKAGDEFKFIPNQPHYLNTNGNPCLVHSILTTNADFQYKPLPKKLKDTLNLT